MTINQSSTWFSILEATAKQPVENIKRHRTRELTQSNTVIQLFAKVLRNSANKYIYNLMSTSEELWTIVLVSTIS